MNVKYYLSILLVLMVKFIFSQVNVSGVVTSSDGQPLAGVSVLIVGTQAGTTTDFDGKYIIEAKSGDVLVFSFIGMVEQKVTIESSTTGKVVMDIVMQASEEMLDEVVVTALGIQKKEKALGYAVTNVGGDLIAQQNVVTPTQALQGRVAGVSVGASDGGMFSNKKIQIRGVSTLNSNNNQPIFVVDGVILENEVSNTSYWAQNSNDYGNILKNINPDNIASISVLKGAAATALYGSRGMNGVVLVKTKSGKGTQGLGVSVSQSLGFDHVYHLADFQNEFGRGTYAGVVAYGKKDTAGNYFKYDTNQFAYNNKDKRSLLVVPSSFSYGPKFDGKPIIGWDGKEMPYSAAKDNFLDLYNVGVNSNTHVALKGSNENGDFYLSDSYNVRTGTFPNNVFNRNTLALRASYKLADWLNVRGGITLTNSLAKNARNNIAQSLFQGSRSQLFFRSFDIGKYKDRKYWQAKHGGVPSVNHGDEHASIPGKYLWWRFHEENQEQTETVVRPLVLLSAKLYDSLWLNVEANMNHYSIKFEEKNLGNGYMNDGGFYKLHHKTDVSEMVKTTLNWEKNFMDIINFRSVVGGEMWRQKKSWSEVYTRDGLVVPGRYFIGNSKGTQGSGAEVFGTKQINSLYFMGDIEYNNELFLNITGRNDWSSTLVYTDGSGNFSYFYPSVSLSWVFTDRFEIPWVDFGKIRLSWAQVGNDTGAYLINRGYGSGRWELSNGSFVYLNSVSNTLVDKDLKSERKNSFEIGTDIRLLDNRLSLDMAYYSETVSDQIGDIPLPAESGYETFFTNIGTIKNTGIEVSLSATPIKTEDFEYNTTFNYWRNRTVITDLHKDYGDYKNLHGSVNYGSWRIGSTASEGDEYGILRSDSAPAKYQSDDPKDPRNGKKILVWSDSNRGAYYKRSGKVEKVGKIQPDFEGSWLNEFVYKGISLSFLIDMRFGGHIGSYSSRYAASYGYLKSSLRGRSPEHGGIEWTSKYSDTNGRKYSDGIIPDGVFDQDTEVTAPDGTKVDVSGMTYKEAYEKGYVEPTHASYYNVLRNSWGSGVINEDWFKEAHYISLRNISLGYRIPKEWASKMGIKGLYVGFNVQNVGYLYNNLPNGINPESFRGTSSSGSYKEVTLSPYLRNYTMTLSLDF